jgi:hypothetical protein
LQFPVGLWKFYGVIPEIDIWRAATLMLNRYGERALEESALRADELASTGDGNGVAIWRRISDAVGQCQHHPARSSPLTCLRHWNGEDAAAPGASLRTIDILAMVYLRIINKLDGC